MELPTPSSGAAFAVCPTPKPEAHDGPALARARRGPRRRTCAPCAPRAMAAFRRGAYDELNLGDHVGDDARGSRSRTAAACARPSARGRSSCSRCTAPAWSRSCGARHGARRHRGRRLHHHHARGWPARSWWPIACPCSSPTKRVSAWPRRMPDGAGWRAACSKQTARSFASSTDGAPRVIAWLGPCIGPEAFEVGPEVKAAFEAHAAQAAGVFSAARHRRASGWPTCPRWRASGCARRALPAVYGNDGSDSWCTVANPSRFFSHRRDGVSGRFAACIWRA